VHDIYLTVNTRDWTQLKEDFRSDTYYLADLRWRDLVVRNAGIRSRGTGTRSGQKPGLRVDFNRYAADQEFLGLKSVVLDNLLQDPSMIRERVVMAFFAAMGLPAPREAHARLFVNNEYAGLYTIVESIDKRFLEREFGEDDGYLYEFDWNEPYGFEYRGDELEDYAEFFKAQTHENDSIAARYATIRDMTRAFSESRDEQFVPAASAFIDLGEFLAYVAVENFLSEQDGMVGRFGMNNFYMYRFENSTRHQIIAWDKDVPYWGVDHPIFYNLDTNVVSRRAMRDPELAQVYVDTLRRCAEVALRPVAGQSAGWLEWQVIVAEEQIRAAAAADPVKPYTNDTVAATIRDLQDFARRRPAFVLESLGAGSQSARRQ
jgi:spore coat protein CotH